MASGPLRYIRIVDQECLISCLMGDFCDCFSSLSLGNVIFQPISHDLIGLKSSFYELQRRFNLALGVDDIADTLIS